MTAGAVPSELPLDAVVGEGLRAPLSAVVLKEMSLLDSRMVVVPPEFCTPISLLLMALPLMFISTTAIAPRAAAQLRGACQRGKKRADFRTLGITSKAIIRCMSLLTTYRGLR
jgi:hypothetical protein